MSKITKLEKKYKCPKCSVVLTLGKSFNYSAGYLCVKCAQKQKIRGINIPEEKEINCKICGNELEIGNISITPTMIVCKNCYNIYINSDYYLPHAKNKASFSKYKSTLTLLATIIIIYIISAFPYMTEPSNLFIKWGALIPSKLYHLELWRLFTANLLHADLSHLFANSFSIAIWGILLEKSIGSRNVAFLIFFSAILTTALSAYCSPYVVSLGASGIAYGLMTAFIIYFIYINLLENRKNFKRDLFSFSMLIVFQVIYNISEANRVDIWGHLGGTIAGLVFITILIVEQMFFKKEMTR
ncbi:MAG: rhomboid family intramembrane serine protease [Cyanobacteriota bacterium]